LIFLKQKASKQGKNYFLSLKEKSLTSLVFYFFLGIEGLEPSRSKRSTDFHRKYKNFLWTLSLSFILSIFF